MDQHVLQCLRATLSPDQNARQQAEQQLRELFHHPEGGASLARILLAQDVDLSQRQSAGILLQQYVSTHWSIIADKFEQPLAPPEAKDQVRSIVFHGLADGNRKIRSASAFVISTIARYDWPEEWPDLLPSLIALLNGGSPDSVNGAMSVVAEFASEELSEEQLLPVIRDLAPSLLTILGNTEAHSATTRAQTVNVFRQIITTLEVVREEHPVAVKQALQQLAPRWLAVFRQLLAVDAAEETQASWDTLAVRIEVFKALSLLQSTFARLIAPDLVEYVHHAVANLASLQPVFQAFYLSSEDDAPEPPSPTSDVGLVAPRTNLDDLGNSVFDFLNPAVRPASIKGSLVSGPAGDEQGTELLARIIQIVVVYTQITRENAEEWMEDPNAFVVDDDDETEQYGLRLNGHDVVGSLIDKYPTAVTRALHEETRKRVEESAAERARGNIDWWKPLEATLSLLGGIADDLRNGLEADEQKCRPPSFDLQYLFNQVLPTILEQSETPFLQARAFVFASQFASLLPERLSAQYLAATVRAMHAPEVTVPVKLSAVKTIKNFCRFLKASVMRPQSGPILYLLLPLLQQATNDTLYLVIETIRAVLALDKSVLNPESAEEVSERVFDIWLKYSTDPILTAVVEEFFEAIVETSPPIAQAIVKALGPRLATLIVQPVTDETVHLPSEAVQLSNSLIRSRGGPLEKELIATATAAIMTLLITTDDMDAIQYGIQHLTWVVRKDCDKLLAWHDRQGNTGIACIFGLLGRFLAPAFSESGGIFVGELIMHMFRKAGSAIGPVLPDLLRAVVTRLTTAQLPSFVQSMIMPFAYLFSTEHTQNSIDLLSQMSVTLPDGSTQSALELVLRNWCETCETITGSWNIRVSDLGMAKLFTLPSEAIRNVLVKGDLIISEANRKTIMTRSKTKSNPNQFTQIAFPVKALKLILHDVQNIGQGKGGKAPADVEEDDGDGDWDDEDDGLGGDNVDEFGYLSSWLDDGGNENDAQDDDEDLKSDPIAQIDLGAHLTDILRQAYTTNSNGMHEMIPMLTDQEKATLRGVLTL